jgi:anti-anti-sigma regulatory factor
MSFGHARRGAVTDMTEHGLQGDLRAGEAESLRLTLLAALEAGNLTITTDAVTSVDAAILQVLISARRTAEAHGRTLVITASDDAPFAQFAARLALTDPLHSAQV